MTDGYHYTLELYTRAGAALGKLPLTADFEPAREWVVFEAVRHGVSPEAASRAPVRVEPVWNETLGQPYTSGFRVWVEPDDADPRHHDFPTAYFTAQAEDASAQLVKSGHLQQGDRFQFAVSAFAHDGAVDTPAGSRFTIQASSPALVVREGELARWQSEARQLGTGSTDDLATFLPERVLEEATRLARRAGARETGGILVGHLERDRRSGELYAVVGAQIPARHTRGELASLKFTPDTWTDVKRVLALRGLGETFQGWWHSHPILHWQCKNCPVERRRRCALAELFSEHDRALHRAVFPRSHSVALVVNLIDDDERTFSMYGWREGQIVSRGFHVLATEARAELAAAPGEHDDAS